MAKNSVNLDVKINVKTIQKGLQGFINQIDKVNKVLATTFSDSKKVSNALNSLNNLNLNKMLKSDRARQELKKLAAATKEYKTKLDNIEAGKYGLGQSRIGQARKKIENASMALQKIQRFGEGKIKVVGVKSFGQAVKDSTDGLVVFTEKGNKAYNETHKLDNKVNFLGESLQKLADGAFSRVNMDTQEFAQLMGMSTAAATGVGLAVMGFGVALKAVSNYLKRVVAQTQQFAKQLGRISEAMRNSVSGIRLATQGILSIARAMTFFVAVPLTAFLKEGVQGAIELEEALVRVQKVTGDMFADRSDLSAFRDEILKLSTVSVSSAEEMANYAEQLGQMGVRSRDAMMEFVAIMDVFAQSTDISAEEVAQDLGSIANAFGKSMSDASEETVAYVNSMAETINALENSVGATASDIVKTLKDMGSSFAGLTAGVDESGEVMRMSFATIAAFGASAREMGMSADEAGTALKNLPGYLIDNADVIDELNIKTDKFGNSLEFINGISRDFQGTVLSLIEELATNASTLDTVKASTELLGRRTGRLLSNLVKMAQSGEDAGEGLGRLQQAIDIANEAWKNGGSLMSEYEKMLATTSVGIKQARHALELLGTTIADDVLPTINKALNNMTAGFIALSDVYGTLDKATKGIVFRFLALGAAFGPVTWFLSQIAFGVSMVVNGLMRIGAVIAPVLGAIGMLVQGLLTLNPVLISIGGLLYSILSQYTDQLQNVRNFIDSLMSNLADDAQGWGEAVMGAFADGVEASAKTVISSVSAVAEAMAMFLEAHSPPLKGPLSSIDMWGEPLMNTWMEGFAKADFGLLSDMAQRAEAIFSAIHFTPSSEDDDSERKKVLKDLINFREEFSELLKAYRSGVDISQEYIDNVLEGLGDGSDELKNLLELSLEYEQVQRRLAEIEEERADISDTYKNRVEAIRLSGATAEEMVEQIASAQYQRDQQNKALSEEETRLERREELLERQISTQEAFLDALEEQSSLWQELLSLQQGGGAGSGAEDIGKSFIASNEAAGEFASKLQELRNRFIELKVQAQKIKGIFVFLVNSVSALWDVVVHGTPPSKAFADLFEKTVEGADVVGHGKDLANDFWSSYGSYDPEEETITEALSRFFDDSGQKLVDSLDENLNADQMKEAVNAWLTESFDLTDTEKKEVMEVFNGSIESMITTANLGAGFVAPKDSPLTGLLTTDDLETSPFETFVSTALAPMISAGETLSEVFGEQGLVKVFRNFVAAFAQGFTGNVNMDKATKLGIGPEEARKPLTTMEQIANKLGIVAEQLVDSVPKILSNLGELAENLTIFMGQIVGIDTEDKSPIEMLVELSDSLVKISNNLSSLDTEAFKTAGTLVRGYLKMVSTVAKMDPKTLSIKWLWKFGERISWLINWVDEDVIPWFEETALGKAIELWVDSIKENFNGMSLFEDGYSIISSFFKGLKRAWNDKVKPYLDIVSDLHVNLGITFPATNLLHKLTSLFSNKQGGGWVFPGSMYNVNETRGGELFTPPYRGKITSATLTSKMMSEAGGYNGGQTIQINIDSPVVRDERDIEELVDTIIYRLGERA